MKLKPKAIPISKFLSQILTNAVKFKKRYFKLIKLCKHEFYFKALICILLISEKINKFINLQISNLNILILCCYNKFIIEYWAKLKLSIAN